MPSLRSYLLRPAIKYFVGRKFRRAGTSITALRALDEFLIKNQKVPTRTGIQPLLVDQTPAEWVRPPTARPDRAILYLHGGAFITGSPATHRELVARLAAAAHANALVLDYRLAPEHPFPAAMQDAVSAYRWLLGEGFAEKHLVVGGDSAGGGLALQTLLAIREEGLPRPAAGFFLSPVTDWMCFDGETHRTRAAVDPLADSQTCRTVLSHYVSENERDCPLLSPLTMDLSGLPPLCIHVGDHEILLSDSVRLAERARVCNIQVEFKIWPHMWHVFQGTARFVPEGRQSIEEIGRFVANYLD